MATIYQVSALAKVSLATVSRVINGNKNVSEKTRVKVEEAMQELGYRPNANAQSLASNRSNCIGLLVPQLDGAYFGDLMAGVESQLTAASKHIIVTTGQGDEAQEKAGIEFLIGRNCDAIIIYSQAVSDDYLLSLNQGNTPIILINRQVEGLLNQCIVLDNELGGYLATEHLIRQGHQHIGCIAGSQHHSDAMARFKGYKRALHEHSISFDEQFVFYDDFSEQTGIEGAAKLLSPTTQITALVCGNDHIASGVMSYARDIDLAIPEHLSVVGFDDVIFARYLHPKLTTMINPIREMGEMAAKWALKNIYQQHNMKIKNIFTPVLIERNSTK